MNVLDQSHGKNWSLYNADSCRAIEGIPDASVGMAIFSPPFENMFTYSPSIADLGNSKDNEEFFGHFRYLVPELKRIVRPGRLCVVHCKDILASKMHHGFMGLKDFPADIGRAFTDAGWKFHSRVTIWKDPVMEMQRTKNAGLLYKQVCKDSCTSRQGTPDYLMVFRNQDGDYADPVGESGERFSRYVGLEPPNCDTEIWGWEHGEEVRPKGYFPVFPSGGKWPSANPFPEGSEAHRVWSIAVWQRYASPVWMDIDQTDVLNVKLARSEKDERHLCPLQLGVVDRCVHLWTNPGDTVFSPFAGIGSELYSAVRAGRKGVGIELKPEYFRQGCSFLGGLESELFSPNLLDGMLV